MHNTLKLKKATENKYLLDRNTYNCINEIFSDKEKDNIFVAKINPDFMDGIKLCKH